MGQILLIYTMFFLHFFLVKMSSKDLVVPPREDILGF